MLATIALLAMTQKSTVARASLVSELTNVKPGTSFWVALRLRLEPKWHVYWQNPGQSGMPPQIDWKLPPGWVAGDIQWPTPTRVEENGILNYVYSGDVLLPVTITVPRRAKPGSRMVLKAKAKWLVCREVCLSQKAELTLPILTAAEPARDPRWSRPVGKVVKGLPPRLSTAALSAWTDGKSIRMRLPEKLVSSGKSAGLDFYPADDVVDPADAQQISTQGGTSELVLKVSSYAPRGFVRLRGLLVSPVKDQPSGVPEARLVDIPIRRRTP